jgi:hypothetical protein
MFQINWKLKSLVYKFLEFFRLKKTLYFIQKKITKRSDINLNEIVFYWDLHLKYLTNNNSTKILEFGAGKSLIQNIFLSYKTNLKFEQTLIDISKMIDLDLFNKANEQVAKILKVERRPFVKNNDDIKKNFNILYSAPTTLNEIKEKNLLFDACISSTVLEHFSIKDLEETFKILKKIIKKDGIISAAIDYSDHYSHTDEKISKLNFLQFSNKIWGKYNNSFLYQNRLRHQDYKKIFINLDYEIIDEIKGDYEKKPKLISNNFDANNKDTFVLWGHFLLKFKK